MKELHHSELPETILATIPVEQKSYIDEFEFFMLLDGTIEAFYDGLSVATWKKGVQ